MYSNKLKRKKPGLPTRIYLRPNQSQLRGARVTRTGNIHRLPIGAIALRCQDDYTVFAFCLHTALPSCRSAYAWAGVVEFRACQ